MLIYTIQQGTVGVSRPKGKLLSAPFLTLVVPNVPHSQTNLTIFQLIPYLTRKDLYPLRSLSNHSTLNHFESLKDSYFRKVYNIPF